MEWIETARQLFRSPKPTHFTNYRHCEECAEHDQALLDASIDTISLAELGSPGWDPICFATPEGVKYYMPALVRLSLESVDGDFYFGQLLFHLELDGPNNALYLACTPEQRAFVAAFVDHMILNYSEQLEQAYSVDEAFRTQAIWSGPVPQ
ncbi:hypothetical protein FV139_16760 [Parahaliea maris]|uniref:Uncharacterized protein n=1 Tax=Parahaliea maris TaxID=2716870 RepID=A0A5C8ZUC6_9GAMM|nr:hypothetical protein [Parahaliea maris]TXS91374.1 hypothetical protein FV139_16760 [Parahaliea maris]